MKSLTGYISSYFDHQSSATNGVLEESSGTAAATSNSVVTTENNVYLR